MKTLQWPLRAFLFVCLVQIISCTKSIDKISNDSVSIETSSDATVANEFSNCKLRRILHVSAFNSEATVSRVFTYNAAGNPYSLVYTSGAPTPNYYFYYDKKNRLKEMLINFSEDARNEYTELHRYGYDPNDVIVTDTAFRPDWEGDELNDWVPYKFIKLTYDSQGRIVKENIRDLHFGTTTNPTYTYDNRGNLAVKGWKSSGYDNKVSIFRAHPLFQFIHRNYSRNNALPEAKYHSKGLPLVVKKLNDQFFDAFSYGPGDNSFPEEGIVKAIYDCQ